jgi:hypothetical protein
MAEKILPVRIALKEEPVIIQSLKGDQLSAEYALWDDITASEFFPPNVNSAFYGLSLEKSVSQASAVRAVEDELIEALELLAAAWPFSGGGFINLATRRVPHAPRYESNAKEIETELLRQARQGFANVECRFNVIHEDIGTYRQPPLGTAVRLAKEMQDNPALDRLLSYYRKACVEYYHPQRDERSSWFIHLYKVRDALAKIYKGEDKARSILNISTPLWPIKRPTECSGSRGQIPPVEIASTLPQE